MIQTVSTAGRGEHNEDLIATFEREGLTDLLILDGATSVADEDYVEPTAGDVVWFVRAFALALGSAIEPDRSQEDSVVRAIEQVRTEYDRRTGDITVPSYAWPIAALTWVRIRHEGGRARLEVWCVGDCKTLLRMPGGRVEDIDPYDNPFEAQLLQRVRELALQGGDDPATRLQRLMPVLRERRAFQNSTHAPGSLCLYPGGGFDARRYSVDLEPGTMLLMMTDGFYRLVDTYGLYDDAGLAEACRERGIAALMQELRAYEQSGAASFAIKRADDASAIAWIAGSAGR